MTDYLSVSRDVTTIGSEGLKERGFVIPPISRVISFPFSKSASRSDGTKNLILYSEASRQVNSLQADYERVVLVYIDTPAGNSTIRYPAVGTLS